MEKLNKILIIYLIIIGAGFLVFNSIYNLNENQEFSLETVVGINSKKIVDVEREIIFDTIADIENYPIILPKNIIDVKIINQTTSAGGANVIMVEQKVSEAGVISTILVKHDILPYTSHKIEIMEGDAKGTIIRANFDEKEKQTEITIEAEIHLHGILAPFGLLTQKNMESALNTMIDSFIEYAKVNNPRLET